MYYIKATSHGSRFGQTLQHRQPLFFLARRPKPKERDFLLRKVCFRGLGVAAASFVVGRNQPSNPATTSFPEAFFYRCVQEKNLQCNRLQAGKRFPRKKKGGTFADFDFHSRKGAGGILFKAKIGTRQFRKSGPGGADAPLNLGRSPTQLGKALLERM